ncbi:HAMP domain-containing sensor histidine kinase [Phytomonospora sp. NPDC050363]|uniref:sensor histidine kinase n=1 Tax=Phytomonospora sp. NPDC050363 TaxID=3155642 RepID=UPI0033D45B21
MRVRRWSHWPVRTRMVVMIVAIIAVALTAAIGTAAVLLRGYLTDRIDKQLEESARFASGQVPGEMPAPRLPGTPGGGHPFATEAPRVYYYDQAGNYLFADESNFGETPEELSGVGSVPAHAADGEPFTVTDADGNVWRLEAVRDRSGGYTLVALSLNSVDSTLARLVLIGGGVSLLILVLLAVGASWVVRIGLRPLTRMEATAARIAEGDLDSRVQDVDPHTETGRLGGALNTMLARIQRALDDRAASEARLRQFLADASHELRTPLTSIKGFAELYRRGGAPPGPVLDDTIGRIEDESERMSLLVDDLMLLASLDRRRPLDRHPVDLLAVAADSVRDAHARAPGRSLTLEALPGDDVLEPVTVPGDEPRLRQVLANLVANALRHTPPDARIVVRLGRSGADTERHTAEISTRPAGPVAVLEVADSGPGLTAGDAARVFERLYRADPSRVRDQGSAASGAGLGLSIVAAIVTGHGGCVQLDTSPGEGATFRVLLPLD